MPTGKWLVLGCVLLGACGRDHFDPTHNIAFVTSNAYDPSTFGADLSGGDAYCQAAAASVGLGGSYLAYLNTDAINAPDRLGDSRGWIRIDGSPLADTVDDLVVGNAFAPLRIDELGEEVQSSDHPVALGLHTVTSDIHGCRNWTDPTEVFDGVSTDEPLFVEPGRYSYPCSQLARIFCFGTGFDVPLAPTAPASSRAAFLTVQGFTSGGGLASADALCAQEASLAGVPGTFLAALGTSTASAASRFDLMGPPWARLDGIQLAATPLDLIAGKLDATLSLTSARTEAYGCVITGGALGTTSPAGTACTDWTDVTAIGIGGNTVQATALAFVGQNTAGCIHCDGSNPIFCLQR